METYNHFSHPHNLSFHKSLEASRLTCTGCNLSCTGTPVYSCRKCKFFLHEQCFDATRSLIHPSHPAHPLSLFPSPTYTSRGFTCDSCSETGSGLCYSCPACDFDLHVHCAYASLNPSPNPNPNPGPSPKQIKLESHPDHVLKHFPKPPYGPDVQCTCDVCGTVCEPDHELYHCDVCGYDAHVECASLPETVRREDHEHDLTLLYQNPNAYFECEVCRGQIAQNHCMYSCASCCGYGIHVKCVSGAVVEKAPMDALAFQLEMFKLQNKVRLHQMALDATRFTTSYHHNRYY